MTHIVLSICIPNFNQGTALMHNIENLSVCSDLPEIEILISDNGSTDIYSSFALEKAVERIPNVRIFTGLAGKKDASNWFSGFGANMSRLIENAKGEYIWFLGSGDLVRVSHIHSLLNMLGTGQYDNLILKAEVYSQISDTKSAELNRVDFPLSDGIHGQVPQTGIYFDHSISCNITKSCILKTQAEHWFFQDSWPHVERYMNFIVSVDPMVSCLIQEPLLLIDQPTDGWFSKPDALEIYFRLGELYAKYVDQNSLVTNKLNFELFGNRILKVVSMVLHLRILANIPTRDCTKFLSLNVGTISLVKRYYLKVALRSPRNFLKILRFINSELMDLQRKS